MLGGFVNISWEKETVKCLRNIFKYDKYYDCRARYCVGEQPVFFLNTRVK